ncbi:hypothetical protein CUMW_049190 [Citrus unshiu]|nr:hypothetical protein CUMW_049190 [Citrus unshiu]
MSNFDCQMMRGTLRKGFESCNSIKSNQRLLACSSESLSHSICFYPHNDEGCVIKCFFFEWILEVFFISNSMKHVVKILTLLVAITALWFGLLQTSVIPRSHKGCHLTLLLLFCQLPIYFIVSLGCYGLLMVGIGLMYFPTCPQEALLLQQDIKEAKEYLERKGIDVSE